MKLDELICNVFLPKQLPNEQIGQSENEIRHYLLRAAANNKNKYYQVVIHSLEKSKQIQPSSYELDNKQLNAQLHEIDQEQHIQFIPLYIHEQNSCLIIKQINSSDSNGGSKIELYAFQVSLPSYKIFQSNNFCNPLYCVIPNSAVSISEPRDLELIYSNHFSDLISELCSKTFSKSVLPQSRKAGQNQIETRDAIDSAQITEWVMNLFADSAIDLSSTSNNFLKKKFCDTVQWKSSKLPFRRSGFYMAMKGYLNLALVQTYGNLTGTLLYKLLMLEFVTLIASDYFKQNFESSFLDVDRVMQQLGKIARKIDKITTKFLQTPNIIEDKIIDFCQETVNKCASKVVEIRNVLDRSRSSKSNNEHKSKVSNHPESIEFKHNLFTREDVHSSTVHKLPKSGVYFQSLRSSVLRDNKSSTTQCLPQLQRIKLLNLLDSTSVNEVVGLLSLHSAEKQCGILLYDLELLFIKTSITIDNNDFQQQRNIVFVNLFNVYEAYLRKARLYYKTDPIGYSRLILACLSAIKIMDSIVTESCSLYLDHHTGISVSVFDWLLLSNPEEMYDAYKLFTYFSARNKSSKYSEINKPETPNENSFSVRYAKDSSAMQQCRVRIEQTAEQDKKLKIQELYQKTRQYNELEQKCNSMDCLYYTDAWSGRIHSFYCNKCSLKRTIRDISIEKHEFPLPSDENLCNAVLFEINIPIEYAILRDSLHLFRSLALDQTQDNNSSVEEIWRDYCQNYIGFSVSNCPAVTLGSSNKTMYRAHYKDKSLSTRPTQSDILQLNALNCVLSCNRQVINYTNENNLKQRCSFQIEEEELEYNSLQDYLSSTEMNQNEILADQWKCHKNLSLDEFISFGSFRAGFRLQYRNLVAALESHSLSFFKTSIYYLVTQSLYQEGPNFLQNESKSFEDYDWLRESHLDLKNEIFVVGLLKQLQTRLDTLQSNWEKHVELLVLITVAIRIYSIESIKSINTNDLFSKFIVRCRIVAMKWIDQNEKDSLSSVIKQSNDVEIVAKLRIKLAEIAACGIMTYAVNQSQFTSICYEDEHWFQYLSFLSVIEDNLVLNSSQLSNLPFTVNLLRSVRITALNIQPHLCTTWVLRETGIKQFIKEYFHTKVDKIEFHDCWLIGDENSAVNIITGSCLYNGKPVGYLPSSITSHSTFQSIFCGILFEVFHDGSQYKSKNSLGKDSNIHYCFREEASKLIITETYTNSTKSYQLIPHEELQGDFPLELITNYSHWLNLEINNLEFRSKSVDDPDFLTKIDFSLNLPKCIILNNKTQQLLLDIHSSLFQSLYLSHFQRLECQQFIYIYYSSELSNTNLAEIHLSRMNLSFYLHSDGLVYSREFPGFYIDIRTELRTLEGLQQGILITESSESIIHPVQSLIIPHGPINTQLLPAIHINTQQLEKPHYYVYNVDHRLSRLTAGETLSSWLYLALLYGYCSSSLPESFTNLTGYEQAFQILLSGYCFRNQPLDDTSVKLLTEIAKLSPIAKYYPAHLKVMQNITHSALPSLVQHYGYYFIAEYLFNQSIRLASKSKTINNPLTMCGHDVDLLAKLYFEHKRFYNRLAQLPSEIEAEIIDRFHLSGVHSEVASNSKASHFNLSSVRKIRNNRSFNSTFNSHRFVSYFTETSTAIECNSIQQVKALKFAEFYSVAVRNIWLALYSIAKDGYRNQQDIIWFQIVLCILATHNDNSDIETQLDILQSVLSNPSRFPDLTFGNLNGEQPIKFENPSVVYSFDALRSQIEKSIHNSAPYWNLRNSVIEMKSDVTRLTECIDRHCAHNLPPQLPEIFFESQLFNVQKVIEYVNKDVAIWYKNDQLKQFLNSLADRVCTKVQLHYPAAPISCQRYVSAENNYKCSSSIVSRPCHQLHSAEMFSDIKQFYQTGRCSDVDINSHFTAAGVELKHLQIHKTDSSELNNVISQRLQHLVKRSRACWSYLKSCFLPTDDNDSMKSNFNCFALNAANLWSPFTSFTLIRLYLTNSLESPLKELTGGLIVIWTLEQQLERWLTMLKSNLLTEFNKEIKNDAYKNWNPQTYPEWLVLQLELNLMIRPTQVEVALHLMEAKTNQLVQLNMGDGKTHVIIPMLCLAIANGENIVRVNILKSLLEMNKESLILKLGGLCNRKVFIFECRRDVHSSFDDMDWELVHSSYEVCMKEKGIVLTLPEHRLSFQLLCIEKCSASMLKLENFLHSCCCDILDESDEILDVKHQLIYTIGSQNLVAAAEWRWITIEHVLQLVARYIIGLNAKYPNSIVFNNVTLPLSIQRFPQIRLLKDQLHSTIFSELTVLIADDILKGTDDLLRLGRYSIEDTEKIKQFLINRNVTVEYTKQVSILVGAQFDKILIIRGLLAYQVLMHALFKRHRVNYGYNPNGKILSAVPFKAKDTAVPRTEFGHTDLSISLTLFHYYYSGLENSQIDLAFDFLKKEQDPTKMYSTWTNSYDHEIMQYFGSIRNWNSVNLSNYQQKVQYIYPAFRYNTIVINYWLNQIIFPKECKIFDQRLSASSWNLTDKPYVIGFSGTNDSQTLYPLSVKQNDLDQLKSTNEIVVNNILQRENNHYHHFPRGVTGYQIIDEIVHSNSNIDTFPTVLVDVGTLIIDLNNEQVAKYWLEKSTSFQGCLYFDPQDRLMVKTAKS